MPRRRLVGAWLLAAAASACGPAAGRCPGVSVAPTPAPVARDAAAEPPAPVDAAGVTAVLFRGCAKDGPDQVAATKALAALDARVEASKVVDDVQPLAKEVAALLATPCFALALQDNGGALAWGTALSLRAWWEDGGHDWLAHYLQSPYVGGDEQERAGVCTAPTPRHALTSESAPGHPLAPLLCPATATTSGSCGRETAGWVMRANSAMLFHKNLSHAGAQYACPDVVKSAAPGSEYATFRACLNDLGTDQDALPLGAFRAPKEGWLLVSTTVFITMAGCRDDLRAYDLATGAAYVHACLDQPGPARTWVGRVPVGAIREAAWMMMLEAETQTRVRLHVEWFDLPAGVRPAIYRGAAIRSQRMFIETSDEDRRSWSWMRDKQGTLVGQASGTLESPNGRTDAERHAAELLAVAEAAFERGCAPAPPPSVVAWGQPGPLLSGRKGDDVALDDARLAGARASIAAASPGANVRACPPLP
jgi:hypothetical protein